MACSNKCKCIMGGLCDLPVVSRCLLCEKIFAGHFAATHELVLHQKAEQNAKQYGGTQFSNGSRFHIFHSQLTKKAEPRRNCDVNREAEQPAPPGVGSGDLLGIMG